MFLRKVYMHTQSIVQNVLKTYILIISVSVKMFFFFLMIKVLNYKYIHTRTYTPKTEYNYLLEYLFRQVQSNCSRGENNDGYLHIF